MTRTPPLPGRPMLLCCSWLAGLVAACLLAGHARAAEEVVHDGMVVQIPSQITTESTNRLKAVLHAPLNRFKTTRAKDATSTATCDFTPGNFPADSKSFGACFELAKYLRSLPGDITGVRTVA